MIGMIGSFFYRTIEVWSDLSTGKKLLLLTLFGFVLRVIVIVKAVTFSADGVAYLGLAREFASGNLSGLFDAVWPPLYPFLVGIFYFIFYDYELSGRIVSLFFGTLAIPVGFYLGRLAYDNRTGLIGAFFVSIHPYMIRYSGDVLTEGLYYFLIAVAAFYGLRGITSGSAVFITAAALFSALSYLTRPEGMALLGIVSLWVLYYGIHQAGENLAKRIVALLAGWTVFILLTLPYFLFIYHKKGAFSISGKMTAEAFIYSVKDGIVGMANLMEFASHLLEAFTIPFFFLFLLGIYKSKRQGFSVSDSYLFSILMFFWIFYLFVNPRRRYFVELMPLALVFSAKGFLVLREYLESKVRAKEKATLALVIVCFAIIAVELPNGLVSLKEDRLSEKLAGRYIKEHFGNGAIIMSRKPHVAFYADGKYLRLPNEGLRLEDVIRYGKEHEAKFLAGYMGDLSESIKDFRDKENVMERIKSFYGKDDEIFNIYRLPGIVKGDGGKEIHNLSSRQASDGFKKR